MAARSLARLVATFSLGIAALAMVLGGDVRPAGAATGATPAPLDPAITYRGDLTVNDVEGNVIPFVAELRVDCAGQPCRAGIAIVSGEFVASLSNDQSFPLDQGRLSVSLPEFGDLCALRWVGAGQLDVVITGTTAAVSRSSAPGGPIACSDGGEATAGAASIAGTVSLVSGSACLIDDSCPVEVVDRPAPENAGVGRVPSVGSIVAATLTPPADPSWLSTLPPIPDRLDVLALIAAVGGALVLSLLVGFPSVLLDSASERVAGWVEARRERRGRAPRRPDEAPPLTVLGAPFAVLALTLSAAASTLVDPGFRPDLEGARVFVTILGAFLVAIAGGWFVVWVVTSLAAWRSRPRVETRPLLLVFVVLAVFASRLSGFQPGIVFGLVAGIGFGTALGAVGRGRTAAGSVLFLFAIGAGGWIGYSLLLGAIGPTPDWLQRTALETLSGITITALSALPIALVPARGLLGHAGWSWSKVAWMIAYVVSLAAFLFVLLPLPDSWDVVPLDLTTWAGWYIAYAVFAVVAWLAICRPWVRASEPSPPLTSD